MRTWDVIMRTQVVNEDTVWLVMRTQVVNNEDMGG